MTLGQFFLGCVTLLVATLIYRWQKSIDLKNKLADLRLEAYSEYLAASHALSASLHHSVMDSEATDEQATIILRFNAAKQKCVLIGGSASLQHLISHSDALTGELESEDRAVSIEETRRMQNKLLAAMRKELVHGFRISLASLFSEKWGKL